MNILTILKNIVPRNDFLTDKNVLKKYLTEPRGMFYGTAVAVIRPTTISQISDIIKICETHNIKIVPQGGNTGLVGAQIPIHQNSVIISLEKMNAIHSINKNNKTVTVQAGIILSELNQELQNHQMKIPVQLGSQQSCQIGGLVATNAGGINSLAYGNMRQNIIDIKALINKGIVIGGTKNLYKNNTGYDLKQLFIGSEGTLGIITDVTLKIQNIYKYKKTFLCSIKNYQLSIELMQRINQSSIASIEAFEIIKHKCIELYQNYNQNHNMPKIKHNNYYILAELASNIDEDNIAQNIETILAKAFDDGLITDAIITKNQTEENELWAMRHNIGGGRAIKNAGEAFSHDIALPIDKLPAFIETSCEIIKNKIDSNVTIIDYGHLGDGNIHYNVLQPKNMSRDEFLAKKNLINQIVYEQVVEQGGTISAEHGIGIEKKHLVEKVKNKYEIELMRQIKQIFDPKDIFNPQKLLPESK